jgi:hypothetical protein
MNDKEKLEKVLNEIRHCLREWRSLVDAEDPSLYADGGFTAIDDLLSRVNMLVDSPIEEKK